MSWDIEYTDEFGIWWGGLDAKEQSSVSVSVDLLSLLGPGLGFPPQQRYQGLQAWLPARVAGAACRAALPRSVCI